MLKWPSFKKHWNYGLLTGLKIYIWKSNLFFRLQIQLPEWKIVSAKQFSSLAQACEDYVNSLGGSYLSKEQIFPGQLPGQYKKLAFFGTKLQGKLLVFSPYYFWLQFARVFLVFLPLFFPCLSDTPGQRIHGIKHLQSYCEIEINLIYQWTFSP